MNKKKLFSVLSTGALAASLMMPATATPVEAASPYANFNTAKYGDRVDIDQTLNNLSNSESFQKEADRIIRAQANGVTGGGEDESEASPFTFDGGTKKFLNRNLKFKDFTLRSVGDNVEIWL